MLYYPSKGQYFNPAKIPLKYDDVFIPGPDGHKIHAWYFPAEGTSKGTFLFFHGNAENLTSHFMGMYWLPSEGYSYLIFDYPGYGTSDGKPTPESTVETGKAALHWLVEHKQPGPLFLYGQSLGGNVALRVALETKNEIPLKAIIIDGSFLSYRGIASAMMAKNWFTWPLQPVAYLLMNDKYAPGDIGDLSPTPILVIHGEKDQVIPVEQGRKLFAKAKEPKQLWLLRYGQHGNSFFTEDGRYRELFLDYLKKLP